MAHTETAHWTDRDALALSAKLAAWAPECDESRMIDGPFSLMEMLVEGALPNGMYYASPALLRRLQWWRDDWNDLPIQEWLDTLVAWGEIAIEPIGQNPYDTGRFDVVIILNKRRFQRFADRPYISPKTRREVFARDGGRCVQCGSTEPLHVDHIHPWSKGGAHEMSNFQTLCAPCNIRKGASVDGLVQG